MSVMRGWGFAIGSLVAVFALIWLVQGYDLFMYKVFAPQYEQVRRDTYEHSRAFNEGMAQDFADMWRQYRTAKSQSDKDAIVSVARGRMAGYDIDSLNNSDVRNWAHQVMEGSL